MYKKLKEAKTFKELFNMIPYAWFSKCAFVLTILLIFFPIALMLGYLYVNIRIKVDDVYFILNFFELNLCIRYILMLYLLPIGYLGLLLAVFYFIKKNSEIGFKNNLKNIKENKYIFCFLLLILLGFISSLAADSIEISMLGYAVSWYQIGFISYFAYIGYFFSASILNEKQKNIVIRMFIIIGSIMCALTLLQSMDIDVYLFKFIQNNDGIPVPKEVYTAVFNQFNHFAYYLTLLIMALAVKVITSSKKYKFLYIALFLLSIHTLIINNTFSCFLGVLIAIVIATILYKIIYKKKISFLPISIFFGYSILMCFFPFTGLNKDIMLIIKETKNLTDDAGTGRLRLWKNGIKLVIKKPFLGYGCESLVKYNLMYFNDGMTLPHNEYIQMAGFFGIPALLCYLLGLIDIIVNRCIKKLKSLSTTEIIASSAVLVYLIQAFFNNNFLYTYCYFLMFLGLIFTKKYEDISENIEIKNDDINVMQKNNIEIE